MKYQARTSFILSLLLALAGSQAFATSFLVPPDRDLVNRADAIVIARVEGRFVLPTDAGGIQTHYDLRVERLLKGTLETSEPLRITEGGGAFGNHAVKIYGTPEYAPGERALIFLQQRGDKSWRTWGMILGRFNFVRDDAGQELLVRGASGEEVFGWDYEWKRHQEKPRAADGFLRFIDATVCGLEDPGDYFVEAEVRQPRIQPSSHGFSALDYEQIFNFGPPIGSVGARWSAMLAGGFVTYRTLGNQTGAGLDSLGAVDRAMNAWNSEPNSMIGLARGGANGTPYNVVSGGGDGINSIEFNATNADLSGPQQIGVASVRASTPITSGHAEIAEADVAIKAGFNFSQTLLDEALTHEIGHTINFRHSNDSPDNTTVAVMNSTSFSAFGANLQAWDTRAASHVYGSGGSSCTPASITSQPVNQTINQGQIATLTVGKGGTEPVTVSWFNAAAPGSPIGSGTSINVQPSSTTSFFARATNSCNPSGAQSNTITITVIVCTAANITQQPTGSTIQQGQQVTLTVAATGTGVTFQWFKNQGFVPGATSSSFSDTPAQTSSYFVRVTVSCGTTVDSNAVIVNVQIPCIPPGITANPQSVTIVAGSSTQLSVQASGNQNTFQWFKDGSALAGANFSTLLVTQAGNYRVDVSGCGFTVSSNTVTVTVVPACSTALITSQPQPKTISSGQSATLTVQTSGTSPSFQWFQNGSQIPGATGSSVTVTPSATSTYFVRVSNACTTQFNSATVTVTVLTGPPPTNRKRGTRRG